MKGYFFIVLLTIFLTGLTLFNCNTSLDIEPLKIEIISPEEGVTSCATIFIELRVADNGKLDRVEVFLDGQLVHTFTSGPFATKLDISAFEEKLIMLKAMAYDREGNTAEARVSINHSHGLQIVSPNGREIWPARSTQTILWEQCGVMADYVSLYYFLDGGSSWTQIIASTPNDGSYLWTLPEVSDTTSCLVKVSSIDASHIDTSDDDFTITRWSPGLAGSCDTPGYPLSVFVSKSYAYMTDGYGGLQIVDISNPTNPILIGSYVTPGDRSWGVFALGDYAYVADGYHGLHVINISHPTSPILTASYNTPGSAFEVLVSGGYAYVADGNAGLQIIDISRPTSPGLIGSYDTPGAAYGIFISGSYAYIADGDAGLQIINISNPGDPTPVGVRDTPGTAVEVWVSASYAYVADRNAGLQNIDISDPANPSLVGSYDTPGAAYGVFKSGSYAYVADGYYGLQIINISNPANPILTGSIVTPDARDVFGSGDYVYVADHPQKLLIFDVSALLQL